MGLRPTRANENHPRRHPRESGGPFFSLMDSRFRGNDVTFGGAASGEGSPKFVEVPTAEILRCAQNDNVPGIFRCHSLRRNSRCRRGFDGLPGSSERANWTASKPNLSRSLSAASRILPSLSCCGASSRLR